MAKKYTADTFEGAVTGDVTGSASLNVLKAGDTMTGNLTVDNTGKVTLGGSTAVSINDANSTSTQKLEVGQYNGFTNYSVSEIDVVARSGSGFSGNGRINVIGGLYGAPRVNFKTDISSTPGAGTNNAYIGFAGGANSELQLQYSATGTSNKIYLRNDSTYFEKPIRIGANASANELDDYEEGTFNQTFYILTMGGATAYDISDFGNGSETSKYVKIGRLVMCTVLISFSTRPSAWATSGTTQILALGTPFTNADPLGHGSWGSFGNTSNLNSYNLSPYRYSYFNTLSFESTRSSSGINFQAIYPYEFLAGVPAGNRQARISYSFYTND